MTKHVLSFDGGGVRCILQAQILNDLYPGLSGHQILKQFDVVTATSAGSVVLGGLLGNMYPYDIFEAFQKKSFLESIFSRTCWPIFPKWSTEKKKAGILKILPQSDQYLSSIATDLGISRILIPAFDVQSRKAHIFDNLDPFHTTLADAINASSTAPITYFDQPASVRGRTYWDGGIAGLNNPAAYGTAIAKEMYPKDDICTLSLGSGMMVTADDLNTTQSAFYPNLIQSCKNLISALVDDAPDVSTRYLWTMTNGAYIRLSPIIGPGQVGTLRGLPSIYYKDPTLGGYKGYCDLAASKLDSTQADIIEKLACVGMHYLNDEIPTQTIPQMDDLNSVSLTNMYYSRLKTKWISYQK